jgi:predicted transcriptional regulator
VREEASKPSSRARWLIHCSIVLKAARQSRDNSRGLRAVAASAAELAAPTPAVSIRNSITPDYLICLDDGKKYKSLRRHLIALGTTAAEYRAKWKLPGDYPMVAANYAAERSALAKKIGLGHHRKRGVVAKSERAAIVLRRSRSQMMVPPGPQKRYGAAIPNSASPRRQSA